MNISLQVLFFLALLILLAKAAGGLAARMGLPAVLGELLAGVVLGATLIVAFSRRITATLRPQGSPALTTRGAAAAQFFVAFYIGYFGAGAGILMMALLALLGMTHIHRINAYKTVQAAACNGVAILAFISRGVIYWKHAGVMVAGALLGGYFGAHYAQKMRQEHGGWIVIAIGLGMSVYFFWKTGVR